MANTSINNENQDLYNVLVEEVKERLQKLKEYGISEKEISSLFHTEQPLLRLTISRNYRIFLGDEQKEIHMQPLVKSVYILFLKHPEGIIFKDLPAYRQELMKIYSDIRPWGLTERAIQSIEDVTNPLLNSINEKCSRVRAAFLPEIDSSLLEQYIITGKGGEVKKITLPRNLVFWE